MLPGTHFYSSYSYSKNSRFIPEITVIPGITYSSFQEPAPGLLVLLRLQPWTLLLDKENVSERRLSGPYPD